MASATLLGRHRRLMLRAPPCRYLQVRRRHRATICPPLLRHRPWIPVRPSFNVYQNTLPCHLTFCFTPPYSLSDPMAVLYEQIPGTSAWRERGRTELVLNNEGKTLQPQSVPRPSRTLCSWNNMVAGFDLAGHSPSSPHYASPPRIRSHLPPAHPRAAADRPAPVPEANGGGPRRRRQRRTGTVWAASVPPALIASP